MLATRMLCRNGLPAGRFRGSVEPSPLAIPATREPNGAAFCGETCPETQHRQSDFAVIRNRTKCTAIMHREATAPIPAIGPDLLKIVCDRLTKFGTESASHGDRIPVFEGSPCVGGNGLPCSE
jgi:hypothetical protein